MSVLIPIVLVDLLANAPFETFSLLPLMLYAAVQILVFTVGFLLAYKARAPAYRVRADPHSLQSARHSVLVSYVRMGQ